MSTNLKGMVLLVALLIIALIIGEIAKDRSPVDPVPTLSLATQTATATPTAGWWSAVATWTPTSTATETPTMRPTRTPRK
jgi:hypothetical protein